LLNNLFSKEWFKNEALTEGRKKFYALYCKIALNHVRKPEDVRIIPGAN